MTPHEKLVRATAWWGLAERLIVGMTRPKVDVASVDAEVGRLARDSALLAAFESALAAFNRGWLNSTLHGWWIDVAGTWRVLDRPQAARAMGVTVLTAATVVLIMRVLRAL